MWRSFILIFTSATTGWANEAVDLSLTEKAVKLLQIENVQKLKKSLLQAETLLKEKDQELEDLKLEKNQEIKTLQVELENTKSSHANQVADLKSAHDTQMANTKSRLAKELEKQRSSLQEEIDKSWTLVDFMMEVVKKSKGAAKTREELVNSQATMLMQLKAEVAECKENIGDSLKMVRDSQKVIQGQQSTIEDLKSVIVDESSLNAAYQKIRNTDCDIPGYFKATFTTFTSTMSTQQEEIENLKEAIAGENTVADLLVGINNTATRGAEIVHTEHGNWGILEQFQDVLEKQSSSLDLLRTLASERVTRDNSLRFQQDADGHIVAADFCQCIPNPPELSSPNLESVSLSLAKVNDIWSPVWAASAWEYNNCEKRTLSNGDSVDIGYGHKTRRRLKALDAESWEEDVEEIPCRPAQQCFNYKELNSPTRKRYFSTPSNGYHCDNLRHGHTRDWKGAGWYRITGGAGTQLADTQVPVRHCGTRMTGSLTGGHPSVEQGEVTRTVNFNWDGSPAWTKTTINVINCGPYYVYYLVETPVCSNGYCTV